MLDDIEKRKLYHTYWGSNSDHSVVHPIARINTSAE
jgi:hypothetical protein